jgi:hypothetical protein
MLFMMPMVFMSVVSMTVAMVPVTVTVPVAF